MHKTALWAFFILFILPACMSLNFSEIVNKDHIEFDSLKLIPVADPYGFRIDLIRKSQSTQVDDSTQTTEAVPYSRLGFSLGNGLFYDLHGNLSISPIYLLGLSVEKEFAVEKTNKRGRSTLYQFANDTLSKTVLPKGKIKILLSKSSAGDTVTYKPKGGRSYSIIKTDSSTVLTGKRLNRAGIYQKEKNSYGLKSQKGKVRFRLSENSAVLNRDIMISQSVDRTTIQILKYRKRQSYVKPIYTMVQNNDQIFIYDKNMRGRKIEIRQNRVYISDGKKILETWSIRRKK